MKYQKAQLILPKELVEVLQEFAEGQYLYIPTKKENHKKWGELSGSRDEIDCRNERIKNAYNNGVSLKEIAAQFFLSIYAVRKIIYNNKSEDS